MSPDYKELADLTKKIKDVKDKIEACEKDKFMLTKLIDNKKISSILLMVKDTMNIHTELTIKSLEDFDKVTMPFLFSCSLINGWVYKTLRLNILNYK